MQSHDRDVQKKNLFAVDLEHNYLFYRRTKIVATIGPASSSPERLRGLITKGLDVARINFSHGNPEDHLQTIRKIRKISQELGKPIAILADLCGPKIRVGRFKNDSVMLRENSTVRITAASVLGDESLIPTQYRRLISEVSVGEPILLDDGNLELKVTRIKDGMVEAKVIRGGLLKNNKGMNLPNTRMKIPALTTKDRKDVSYCIQGEVDFIALSFVRRAQDVLQLKNLLRRSRAEIPVIAKIEKPEALQNIREILAAADGIMIARGDLGVELPVKKVPMIQNKLIEIANQENKPVIVATQMLESMIENSRPTRAEVTDVSGACLAGTDAVMMSAETASGKYPIETFEMMDSILREAEAYQFFARGGVFKEAANKVHNRVKDALSAAIVQISRDLMVRCIFVATTSGYTAGIISSDRPAAPVIALTPSAKVFRRLKLLWGVVPHLVDSAFDPTDYLDYAERLMKRLKLAGRGDFLLLLSRAGKTGAESSSIVIHQIR